jgi:hypothetical protein
VPDVGCEIRRDGTAWIKRIAQTELNGTCPLVNLENRLTRESAGLDYPGFGVADSKRKPALVAVHNECVARLIERRQQSGLYRDRASQA